jgi:hypothetical protein
MTLIQRCLSTRDISGLKVIPWENAAVCSGP